MLPAPALFISAALFQYVGAAIAIGLFGVLDPGAVVWWRIIIGGVGMVLLWRPWWVRWTPRSLGASVLFGLALAGTNLLFYEAIARIPLGATVSLEFLGPVAVAVLRGRGREPRIAAGIALVGVVLIGGLGLDLTDATTRTGFFFGLAAGAAWAGYILLGARISQSAPPGPSLAVGMVASGIVFLPFLWSEVVTTPLTPSSPVVLTWGLVLMLVGVGLFSTTIPYSIEAVAFSRLPAATFALLTALLPATSTLVGAVALRQIPTVAELIGLVLISVAVWLASRAPSTN